jgi:hypothetical protein
VKHCKRCNTTQPLSAFPKSRTESSGLFSYCKACERARHAVNRAKARTKNDARSDLEAAATIRRAEERARRLASDFEALQPEDFDVSIGNDGRRDRDAAREKRQEFSRSMGEHFDAVRAAASVPGADIADGLPPGSGTYIGKLAEQERRFSHRRLARSISLADAHEALAIRHFKQAAAEHLRDKITPTGYALRRSHANAKRSVVLLLSDLHLGSDLSALDEPVPFRAVEEARRLEYLLRQALDYKPQYRKTSELVLLLNGDMIEGQLGHELRSGAPLTEQKVIFWKYFRAFIGYCAQVYPSVRVFCQPGNHGRDKVRHPGRATSRKWDGHEWELYWGLREMSSGLRNVSWTLDFRAVSAVGLHGSILGLTHGDTEIRLGHPDTRASANAAALDRVNMSRVHGHVFDAWAVGHYHTPRFHPGRPSVIYNGMLVPPNGYARTQGYVGEPCGQWIWEAVEGFPIGDLRYIAVGEAQDRDESLGSIIQPFRFEGV